MRGDQLARQWRVIRAIEASPVGLTVAEIAKWINKFSLLPRREGETPGDVLSGLLERAFS